MTKHSKEGKRTQEPLRLSPKEREDIDVVKDAIGEDSRQNAIRQVFGKLADLLGRKGDEDSNHGN